jgi:hypothetical protein
MMDRETSQNMCSFLTKMNLDKFVCLLDLLKNKFDVHIYRFPVHNMKACGGVSV